MRQLLENIQLEQRHYREMLQGFQQQLLQQQQPRALPPQDQPPLGELTPWQQLQLDWQRGKQVDTLNRNAPIFKLGELTWFQYMDVFRAKCLSAGDVSDQDKKTALYTHLQGEAFKLACPDYNAGNPEFQALTFEEYAHILGQVFEPDADTEQARLEFEARVQAPGETAAFYWQDKFNLWDKAFKGGSKDYGYFYEKVITGLINMQMRDYLRLMLPTPLSDVKKFRESIVHVATVVRKKLVAGEIDHSAALGSETHTTLSSYRTANATNLGIKMEPSTSSTINEVHTGNEVNAVNHGSCFYCKSMEHLIAKCPRRLAGLPPAVSGPTAAAAAAPARPTGPKTMGPNRPFGFKPKNARPNRPKTGFRPGQTRPKSFTNWKDDKGQVMCIFQDENDETVFDLAWEEDWLAWGNEPVQCIQDAESDFQPDHEGVNFLDPTSPSAPQ